MLFFQALQEQMVAKEKVETVKRMLEEALHTQMVSGHCSNNLQPAVQRIDGLNVGVVSSLC